MFIDDEMDIDEKIEFVEAVRRDDLFADETLDLVYLEKTLRSDVVDRVPTVIIELSVGWFESIRQFFRPMGIAASTLGVTVAILLYLLFQPPSGNLSNRFVIYRPDVSGVEITGTFTEWKRIAMHRIGTSGYWEISLSLPEGEHRYTYILEDGHSFADPTIPARETDDFGGQNTIIGVRYNT